MTSASIASRNLEHTLEGLPEEYLKCRLQGHWWEETAPMHIVGKGKGGDLVYRELECLRCGTERTDRFVMWKDRLKSFRLKVLGARYKHPTDYRISEMLLVDKPREVLRFEQYRRSMGKVGR